MSDYQKVGEQLKKQWVERRRRLTSEVAAWLEAVDTGRFTRPAEWDFTAALFQHARGDDSSELINYLRLNRPLLPEHRHQLADVIEGFLKKSAPRGRPRQWATHDAAMAASAFYRAWQQANRAQGVKDRGQNDSMRSEAARFACEELEPPRQPVDIEKFIEKVIYLMGRPDRRQNSRNNMP